MNTDEILQQDVRNALKWEPSLAICDINVSSIDGAVTLTGRVDNYIKKTEAENIALKVADVKSVKNMIDITLNSWDEKKDIEITAEILAAFRWNWNTLDDTIKVKVINGWITLSGEVEWNYQKEAAESAVTNLIGIKGVSNKIALKSKNDNKINGTKLKCALQNHIALDPIGIEIVISNSNITLKGTVGSSYQKKLAGRIAWKAQGVINVDNELVIEGE